MWGGVFVAYAKLLPTVDATQIVTIRFVLISICYLSVFFFFKGTRPKVSKSKLGKLFVLGALGVPGSQLPAVHAQNYLSPSLASVLITTSPAWTAVFAAWLLRERFRSVQILGFIIAFFGALLVITAGSGKGDLTVDNPWGAALCLLSPFMWALFTVKSKEELSTLTPFSSVGVCLIAGTIVMAPFIPNAVKDLDHLSASQWGWMLYTVVGGTLIPYWIWFWALQKLDASKTIAYMYAIPFAALIWTWIVLNLLPDWWAAAGGVILIAGVVMTQKSNQPDNQSSKETI
jgi:drug/metabolite transporter (DMT)-like permease